MLGDFCGCDKKVLAAEVVTMGSLPGWSQQGAWWWVSHKKMTSHCTFGCFLKWWYPQNTPKWSFLVGKAMVVEYHNFRKPPFSDLVLFFAGDINGFDQVAAPLRITLAQACQNISSLCRPLSRDVQLTSPACVDHWIRFRTHFFWKIFEIHRSWADMRKFYFLLSKRAKKDSWAH